MWFALAANPRSRRRNAFLRRPPVSIPVPIAVPPRCRIPSRQGYRISADLSPTRVPRRQWLSRSWNFGTPFRAALAAVNKMSRIGLPMALTCVSVRGLGPIGADHAENFLPEFCRLRMFGQDCEGRKAPSPFIFPSLSHLLHLTGRKRPLSSIRLIAKCTRVATKHA